jgi:hypothetical protein
MFSEMLYNILRKFNINAKKCLATDPGDDDAAEGEAEADEPTETPVGPMDSEDTAETEPSSEPESAPGEPENVDGAVGGSDAAAAAAASTKPASEPRLIPPDLVKKSFWKLESNRCRISISSNFLIKSTSKLKFCRTNPEFD